MKRDGFYPISPAPACSKCGRAFVFDGRQWLHPRHSRCDLAVFSSPNSPRELKLANDDHSPGDPNQAEVQYPTEEDWDEGPAEYTPEMQALADAGLIPSDLSWHELDFWERELSAAQQLIDLMEHYPSPDHVPPNLLQAILEFM